MAFDSEYLAELERVYGRGLTEVRFNGRSESYADGADLWARITRVRQEIAAAAAKPIRRVRIEQVNE